MSAENVTWELQAGNAPSNLGGTATAPYGVFRTPEGYAFGWCNGTPANSTVGFAPHALVIDTSNGVLYCNTNTKASATFTAITVP